MLRQWLFLDKDLICKGKRWQSMNIIDKAKQEGFRDKTIEGITFLDFVIDELIQLDKAVNNE